MGWCLETHTSFSLLLFLFFSTNASQMLTPASHAQASNLYMYVPCKGKEKEEMSYGGNKHISGGAVTG